MNLIDELCDLLCRYVAGADSLDALYFWLPRHLSAIVAADGDPLGNLATEVWTIISEWQAGDMTEQTARQQLANLIP